MEITHNMNQKIVESSIVELEMKDFIELLTIADMGWQPDRPQEAAKKWLPRISTLAKSYGLTWTGRSKKEKE